ncbi:MAG: hypothetical protein CME54_06120 [Halieaceae bacterium]|nr:hypothetical protein [Halieaceae bacterium]
MTVKPPHAHLPAGVKTMRFLRGRGFFVMTQVLICLCLTGLALVGPLQLVLTEWALTSQEVEMSSKS